MPSARNKYLVVHQSVGHVNFELIIAQTGMFKNHKSDCDLGGHEYVEKLTNHLNLMVALQENQPSIESRL